jgi:hypothetical protein
MVQFHEVQGPRFTEDHYHYYDSYAFWSLSKNVSHQDSTHEHKHTDHLSDLTNNPTNPTCHCSF